MFQNIYLTIVRKPHIPQFNVVCLGKITATLINRQL